jgi:tetratricopeptide (TPR) repeat protein
MRLSRPPFLPAFHSARWVYVSGLLALVLIGLLPVAIAQTRRPPAALQQAERALIEGRYDEVATITERLDGQDPEVAAVRARALVARGRYQEAETLLAPVARRAPTSEAALELGLLLQMLSRPEAEPILNRIADTADARTVPADLARAARALLALERTQEANVVYSNAVSYVPNDPVMNAAWGDLFLAKNKNAEALKSYQIALDADQKFAPAMIGFARALADDDPPKANQAARKALEINPNSVDTYLFLAGQAVDAGSRPEARQLIQKALAVNPSSLDAIALLAGLAYVEDKAPEYEAQVAKALSISPKDSEVFRVAGDLAAHNYRFDEAVALARRALTLKPQDPRALSDLGVHLLRTGDEPGARAVLDASFKIEPFNTVTYNLLQMMDTLDKFVTVQDGDIVLRMDKNEAPVLTDYALRIAHQALASVSSRYGFKPKGPILIEIFPKHDDFAVRNVGLPGMTGALGACFGRVVTMDSPKARPPGEFQWEATLWHELTHVITLQMSEQRIARWLTEGISVYEETIARPEWGRGMDLAFAQMLNANKTLKLKDLNAAFTNPQQISVAYFEASLLVEHLVATFGDEGLHKLVRAYGDKLDTDGAVKQAFNTDLAGLQGGFDQFLEKRYGTLRRALALPADNPDLPKMPLEVLRPYAAQHPGSYPVQLYFGNGLRKAGDLDQAIQAFERAAALAPVARDADSPQRQIAEIAIEKNDRRRAITALRAVLDADFDNVEVARKLAKLYRDEGTKDPAVLRWVYERIAAIDPFDAEVHGALGALAFQRNDADTAIRERRAVLALGPVDRVAALTDLAESYVKGGRTAEAKKQVMAALEIAPSYERAQGLLLSLAGSR